MDPRLRRALRVLAGADLGPGSSGKTIGEPAVTTCVTRPLALRSHIKYPELELRVKVLFSHRA